MKSSIFLLTICMTSCSKDTETSFESNTGKTQNVAEIEALFEPSEKIRLENGMLVFESEESFKNSMDEFWRAPIAAVVKWQESIGFYSWYRHFYEVMIAEDKIDEYYESLPKEEQDKLTPEDRPESEELTNALENGFVKMTEDSEGDYWGYGLWKVQYSPFANEEGFFKVGSKLYMVDQTSFRVLQDGSYEKKDFLKSIENEVISDELIVIFKDEDEHSRSLNYSFGIARQWFYVPSNTNRRIMIWIDGHSEPYGSPLFSDCAQFIDVTFLMRCEAQKKSWGKWKYSSSYSPSFHIRDGDWSYVFNHWNGPGCNGSSSVKYSGLNGCSTSPLWDFDVSSSNNGVFCMRPDGIYYRTSSEGYYRTNANVDYYDFYDIDYAGYGTLGFSLHFKDWNIEK